MYVMYCISSHNRPYIHCTLVGGIRLGMCAIVVAYVVASPEHAELLLRPLSLFETYISNLAIIYTLKHYKRTL